MNQVRSNQTLCAFQSEKSLTHSGLSQLKPPDNFGDISLTKAMLRKYLNENC